jgi:hypothetical protein
MHVCVTRACMITRVHVLAGVGERTACASGCKAADVWASESRGRKDLPAHADVLEARVVGGIQLLQPLQVLQIVLALWPRFILDLISPGGREVSLGALSTLAPFPAPPQPSSMAVPLPVHPLTHRAPRFARCSTQHPPPLRRATRRLRSARADTGPSSDQRHLPTPTAGRIPRPRAHTSDQAARRARCRTKDAAAHGTCDEGLDGGGSACLCFGHKSQREINLKLSYLLYCAAIHKQYIRAQYCISAYMAGGSGQVPGARGGRAATVTATNNLNGMFTRLQFLGTARAAAAAAGVCQFMRATQRLAVTVTSLAGGRRGP